MMTGQPKLDTERRCHDCGQLSPETRTSYTLIGAAHGWRLVRRVDKFGEIVLEWRCPACWELHKQRAAKSG